MRFTPAPPPLLIQKQGGQGGTYKSCVYLEVFQLFATPVGPDVTTQFTTQREEHTLLQLSSKICQMAKCNQGYKKNETLRRFSFFEVSVFHATSIQLFELNCKQCVIDGQIWSPFYSDDVDDVVITRSRHPMRPTLRMDTILDTQRRVDAGPPPLSLFARPPKSNNRKT